MKEQADWLKQLYWVLGGSCILSVLLASLVIWDSAQEKELNPEKDVEFLLEPQQLLIKESQLIAQAALATELHLVAKAQANAKRFAEVHAKPGVDEPFRSDDAELNRFVHNQMAFDERSEIFQAELTQRGQHNEKAEALKERLMQELSPRGGKNYSAEVLCSESVCEVRLTTEESLAAFFVNNVITLKEALPNKATGEAELDFSEFEPQEFEVQVEQPVTNAAQDLEVRGESTREKLPQSAEANKEKVPENSQVSFLILNQPEDL